MNTIFAILLVLTSAITHSVWNLFMKKSVHKESFLWFIQTIAAVLFMPFFLHELFTVDLTVQKIVLLFTSFIFQSVYLMLLSWAYKAGEMSQVYPLMRGTAALLIPLLSIVLYKEQLFLSGWLGLSLIVIGLFALSGLIRKRVDKKNVFILLITGGVGLSITAYTMIDKLILSFMSPIALIQVYNLAGFLSLGVPALRSKKLKAEWKMNRRIIMIGAIMAPGSYLLFLFAMQYAPLSYISPIRELSIIFGSILGWIVLKEKQGMERIIYSAIVVFGIVIFSFNGMKT